MYTAFIRPVLDYGDIVRDNCAQYEKQESDKVLIEAARIVTDTTKLIYLKLTHLTKDGNITKLLFFYKMTDTLSPSYLSDLVPQSV